MLSRRRWLHGSAAGAAWLAAGPMRIEAQPRAERERAPLDPEVHAVFTDALARGRALREGRLAPTEWQDQMPALLTRVTVDAIARALDLPRLRRRARTVARGCATLALPYPTELGGDEGAAMRVFFFEAGRTDPPHVHFNSVTTHLVLEGRFQVRHWDRLREASGDERRAAFVLRETHDRTIGPGESTSISEPRDNGHWHRCLARGVLLDIEQGRLDPSIPPRNRQMIDLSAATREGEFVAPAITNALALRRYG
jgi:hypothetical protein